MADTRSGGGRSLLWGVTAVLGLAFFAAGAAKISGSSQMVEAFQGLGLPDWFRVLVGVGEVAGAIGLLVRSIAGLAALGLAGIMVGAVVAHVAMTPLAAGIPALVLLILCLVLSYLRLADLSQWLTKLAGDPT